MIVDIHDLDAFNVLIDRVVERINSSAFDKDRNVWDFLAREDVQRVATELAEMTDHIESPQQAILASNFETLLVRKGIELAEYRLRIRKYNEYWVRPENAVRRLNDANVDEFDVELHRAGRDYLLVVFRRAWEELCAQGGEDYPVRAESGYYRILAKNFSFVPVFLDRNGTAISLNSIVSSLEGMQIDIDSDLVRFRLIPEVNRYVE